MIGLGAVVFSLPHFTSGKYEFSQEVDTICSNSLNQTNFCSNKDFDQNLSNYKWIFFLGQFLHGVGGMSLLLTILSFNLTFDILFFDSDPSLYIRFAFIL